MAWERVRRAFEHVAQAAAHQESHLVAVGIEAIRKANVDIQVVLDALHLPEDAGDYEDGLLTILRRIPDGQGRWIGCERGWYSLLTGLDWRLAALDPGYEVLQVGTHLGSLSFYWCGSEDAPSDAHWEMDRLVKLTQRQSLEICERCGLPGTPHVSGRQLKTVCPNCATRGGYRPCQRAQPPIPAAPAEAH